MEGNDEHSEIQYHVIATQPVGESYTPKLLIDGRGKVNYNE